MTTIFERVKSALDTLSPAVPFASAPYESLSALPDLYITYQLIDGGSQQHADDAETMRSYLVQISIFSRAGLVNLPNVNAAMLAAGFEKSRERQLQKDQETGHHGLAKDYIYLEGV
jgi:hypothetical protein